MLGEQAYKGIFDSSERGLKPHPRIRPMKSCKTRFTRGKRGVECPLAGNPLGCPIDPATTI